MKTDIRHVTYALILFSSIYTFFAAQLGFSVNAITYSNVINYFTPSYVYNTALALLGGSGTWYVAVLNINLTWLQIGLAYFISIPMYIASVIYGIGLFISVTLSFVTYPFSILPTSLYDTFTVLIISMYVITIVTSIEVFSTSAKGEN